MSKRHFEALAAALKHERPEAHWNANKLVQWDLDCKAIARACQQSNPRFDAARFYKACGELFNA